MADHFCLDRAVGHGCHSEIRNVNRIRKRVDFLFWDHGDRCVICLWVHKIRDRIFKHQLQMADGHSLCVWMFGIGILHTWLQKPSFGRRFCHCIAFTGGIRNFGVLSASTSLVIARYIGIFESNPMAMIFWPSQLMTLGAAVYIWD